MNKRLNKILTDSKDKIEESKDKYIFLDTYNNIIVKNISPTITTRVSASNNLFILENKDNERKKDNET